MALGVSVHHSLDLVDPFRQKTPVRCSYSHFAPPFLRLALCAEQQTVSAVLVATRAAVALLVSAMLVLARKFCQL